MCPHPPDLEVGPSDHTPFIRLQVEGMVRASMVSTLQTSLATSLDAQWRFVQLGSGWESPAISTLALDNASCISLLFTGRQGPSPPDGEQVHTLSWKGPQGPVSILPEGK